MGKYVIIRDADQDRIIECETDICELDDLKDLFIKVIAAVDDYVFSYAKGGWELCAWPEGFTDVEKDFFKKDENQVYDGKNFIEFLKIRGINAETVDFDIVDLMF